MGRVVLDQVMRAVIELPSKAQVKQAGSINRQDLKAERIFLDRFQAQLVRLQYSVLLIESLGFDTQDVDVLPGNELLEDVLPLHLGVKCWRLSLLCLFYLEDVNLFEPSVFGGEAYYVEKLLLLSPRDQLAVCQSVKGFDICGIFLQALGIALDSHKFVVLRFKALCLYERFTTLHLLVTVAIVQLHLQDRQAQIVLLVHQECPGSQQLKTDVFAQEFMLQEERVHFFEIIMAKVALSQEVDCCHVTPREGYQLITEEYRIRVVVDVQVIHCQIIQSSKTLVPQHHSRKSLQLNEVVLRVTPIVGLKQLCKEEDSMSFSGREYRRLLGLPTHKFQIQIQKNEFPKM